MLEGDCSSALPLPCSSWCAGSPARDFPSFFPAAFLDFSWQKLEGGRKLQGLGRSRAAPALPPLVHEEVIFLAVTWFLAP